MVEINGFEERTGGGGDARLPLLVSVVMPTYNRHGFVRKALAALLAQDLDPSQYEVIVVDGSPDDSTQEVVRQMQPESRCALSYHRAPPEHGAGTKRNRGVEGARAPIIAFTDDDCEPDRSWLRKALPYFADLDTGMVQGKVLPDPNSPHGVFQHYIQVEQESIAYETANMLYRRDVVVEAGGFREFAHVQGAGGEDLDLAWRVKRKGWRSRFAPDAVVYHARHPIGVGRWLAHRRMLIWPLLARQFPELRRHFFLRYFYDPQQAAFLLSICGILLAWWHPLALFLASPYTLQRLAEPSATLRGPKKLLRIGAYFLRDACNFALLLAGSVRYRSVLL